jgi:hypothetical protein
MPARKPRRAAPDALASLKVEVFAALGETSFKAECTLSVAAEVAARLHQELERMGQLRPTALPHADAVPAGTLYVSDDPDDGYRRKSRVGF